MISHWPLKDARARCSISTFVVHAHQQDVYGFASKVFGLHLKVSPPPGHRLLLLSWRTMAIPLVLLPLEFSLFSRHAKACCEYKHCWLCMEALKRKKPQVFVSVPLSKGMTREAGVLFSRVISSRLNYGKTVELYGCRLAGSCYFCWGRHETRSMFICWWLRTHTQSSYLSVTYQVDQEVRRALLEPQLVFL